MTRNTLAKYPYIRRIRIERLFGRYSYDLKCDRGAADISKLLILYGDNGSGKTTLLKLIFDLLTHVDRRGHKTSIAKTRFKRLTIDLSGGIQVSAVRRGANLIGSYRAFIRHGKRVISQVLFQTDKDNDIIRPSRGPGDRATLFLNALAKLKIALFFVTDDRQLQTNTFEPQRAGESPVRRAEQAVSRGLMLRRRRIPPRFQGKLIDFAVRQALDIALEWVREQVLSGSEQGEADANTVVLPSNLDSQGLSF